MKSKWRLSKVILIGHLFSTPHHSARKNTRTQNKLNLTKSSNWRRNKTKHDEHDRYINLPIPENLLITWPTDRPSAPQALWQPRRKLIAHQCCGQLTAFKTGYPLTRITWLYRGLRCRPIKVEYFFGSYPLTIYSFSNDRRLRFF